LAAIQKWDILLAPNEHTELKFRTLRQKYLKKSFTKHITPLEKGKVVLGA
jgi:hypothetical protein